MMLEPVGGAIAGSEVGRLSDVARIELATTCRRMVGSHDTNEFVDAHIGGTVPTDGKAQRRHDHTEISSPARDRRRHIAVTDSDEVDVARKIWRPNELLEPRGRVVEVQCESNRWPICRGHPPSGLLGPTQRLSSLSPDLSQVSTGRREFDGTATHDSQRYAESPLRLLQTMACRRGTEVQRLGRFPELPVLVKSDEEVDM